MGSGPAGNELLPVRRLNDSNKQAVRTGDSSHRIASFPQYAASSGADCTLGQVSPAVFSKHSVSVERVGHLASELSKTFT